MEEKPKSKKGIVLTLVLLALGVVAAAVGYFYSNPVGVGVFLARQGLAKAGLEKVAIDGPGGKITYFRGKEGPPLVLIHGVGNQAGSWVKVAGDLSLTRKLIVPDLAGHGESGPAAGPLRMADLVAGLGAVLDAEKVGGDAVLVGNSMGGWVAMRYALAHPERVSRLVLVDSSGIYGDLGGITLLPKTREEALELVRAIGAGTEPDPAGFVLDDLIEKIGAGATPRVVAGLAAADFLEKDLAGLATPADLLWGAADKLLPLAYGRRLEAMIPRARFTELPGAGHVPQQQVPRLFVEKLTEILAAAPPGPRPEAPAGPAVPAPAGEPAPPAGATP